MRRETRTADKQQGAYVGFLNFMICKIPKFDKEDVTNHAVNKIKNFTVYFFKNIMRSRKGVKLPPWIRPCALQDSYIKNGV